MKLAALPLLTVSAAVLVAAAEWWVLTGPADLFRLSGTALLAAFAAWLILLVWSLVRSRLRAWPLLLTVAIVLALPVLGYLVLRSCADTQVCF